MQQQYGDRYAQKVEDRLLQYLQKLETALPVDAYIDQVCVSRRQVLGVFRCCIHHNEISG